MTNVSPCSSFSLSAWRWCKFIPFYFCIQDPDPSYNIQCQNTRMVFFKHWTTGILWNILLIYNVSLSYIREEKRKDNDKMIKKKTMTKTRGCWHANKIHVYLKLETEAQGFPRELMMKFLFDVETVYFPFHVDFSFLILRIFM